MTFRIARHLAATLVILTASWASVGCGDSGTTTIPEKTPPPKTTPEGKPMPPPTAAQPKAAP